MKYICPLVTDIGKDERFQQLKKTYSDKKMSDHKLLMNLQAFRENEDLDFDWYPETESEYKAFTNFLDRPKRLAKERKVSKKAVNELYKTLNTLYDTPAELNERVNLITQLFRDYVSRIVDNSSFGVSRQQAIERQGNEKQNGFNAILDKVFSYIDKLSTLEAQEAWYKRNYPQATDSQLEADKDWLKHRAEEFAKMRDNKEALSLLASLRIGAKEGFNVNIDGYMFNFAQKENLEELSFDDNEEDGVDAAEASKGERYDDYRLSHLMSTISTRARGILENISMIDRNGKIVRNDLGYPVRVNEKQAVITLHKIMQATVPGRMITDLHKASVKYPWIKSLITYLQSHPDDEATIYCNFKRARCAFFYTYKDNGGRLNVKNANGASNGTGLSREAGLNVGSGVVAGEKYNIVDKNGKLVSGEKLQTVKSVLDKYQKFSNEKLKMKPLSTNEEKRKWTTQNASAEWKDMLEPIPESEFQDLADVLSGIGFVVSAEDVKYALLNTAPIGAARGAGRGNDSDVIPQTTSLERLLSAINGNDGIISRAEYINKEGKDLTGSHLYNYTQDIYKKIADVLAPIQSSEVEERIISRGKSFAASMTPNALHDMVDKLSNVANLSDQEYREMIMNDYGQFEGMALGFGNDMQLTGWLSDLYNDGNYGSDASYKNMRKSFKIVDCSDVTITKQKDYARMTAREHLINSYVMYMRGTQNRTLDITGHMYEVPIQADYETAYNFIVAPSYSYPELVERLAQEVECEAQRISAISERKANDPADSDRNPIRPIELTYEKNGTTFKIFPELNNKEFLEKYQNANPTNAHQIVKNAVDEQLRNIVESERKYLTDKGFFKPKSLKLLGIKDEKDKSINEWLLNAFYARQQMTKLLYGGLEHFAGVADFEKRNMYAHAPRIPLYTKAVYRGEQVGQEDQRVLYLGDDKVKSAIFDNISAIAKKLNEQGKITKDQMNRMTNAYKSITDTDGQGLRTLDSMRKVKIMAGIWTDADETAYKHITSPDKNYTPEDVEHFIVGLKPVYTGYETLPAQPGKYQKPVRVPVLHKYSEMVLLPEMLEALNPQAATSPLKALNKINDHLRKNSRPEIDLFLFGSCVKVGQNAVLGVFDKNTDGSRKLTDSDSMAKFVTDKLDKQTFWIHSLPYKYYGLTASMHDDVVDEHIAWATQAQKQAWANINESEELTVAGYTMKSTEARKLFYDIIAARTVDTYKRINERLSDPKEVATLLKEEIASKPYKSRELIFALQGRDSGRFALPLYSPNIQHDVTALLASIVKKAFTKIPTKGANMTQTTSFGMDQEATGTYFSESMESQGFSPLEVKFDDKGNFKYVEAYIPIHDSRLLKYADSNGNITPANLDKLVAKNIIPESILNFIAYRTPSDAEHSVIPCRIKGFISNAGGPSIRLPREIMAMTGHDYDGDKMRCHFKEFRTGWDNKAIRKDFETFSDTEAVQAILSANSDPTLTPYEVFRRNVTSDSNPDSEKYKVIKSIDYDYSKTPLENIGENSNYNALNNALVDLLFAQLTSENGGPKMFIPGGSGETATYADEIGTRKQATEESPFTVSHATESHGYMMEGANMIGVYAMYSSAGAMNQRIKLSYIPQTDDNGNEIAVTLFGKRIGELNPILTKSNSEDTFTTLTEARFVNAAVDNGKDPLLGYLNQTQELSAITNFLVCAGISEKELHLLLNQPVIKELANRLKEGTSFQKAASAINKELVGAINKKYDADAKYSWIKSISAINKITSNTDNLTGNLNKSFNEILDSPRSTIESQIFTLQTLQYLNNAADDLSEFIKLTRPESDSGGIDASIGGIISKRIQLENFRQRLLTGDISISGMYDVLQEREVYENSMTPDIIQEQMGTALPEVVALNTLMKDSILGLLKNYFPQARNSWMDLQMRIANHYDMKNVKGDIIEGIGSDMILWKLLSNTAFITENPQEEQKRIVQDVPEQVRALKQRIEDAVKHPGTDKVAESLKGNIFIKNLELGATVNSENENISRLRFQLNGTSLEDTADTIRADWSQMLYTGDPEIVQLAKDLFKYNLYTNGFNYGRYEFAHFAPYSILQSTPGYLKALNDVLTSNWAQDEANNFYHQYLRNHWGDDKLIPKFNPNQIPTILREQIGFNLPLKKAVTPANFTASLEGKSYIILNTSENNKPVQTLYELIRDDTGAIIGLEKAEKLGIRNGSGQAIKQYNPSQPDYKLVKPTFIGNQVAWGVTEQTSDVDEEEMARQAAIDDQEYQFGPVPDVQAMKQTEKLAKEAVKHNDNISEDGKLSAADAAMFGFEDEEPVEETLTETESIKQEAIANGTFMKAPNGNPTNLTEKQWLQVRTKAFKEWFGDWENDPANASKVVDENGEPLVVYHGTLAEFSKFDRNKLGEATGRGYYTDKLTGEKVDIDSTYAFFFTNNFNAAANYRNLSIYAKNEEKRHYYDNIIAKLHNSSILFHKLEGEQKQRQADFIDNVLSPIMGYDVRKALNSNTLNKEEQEKLENKVQELRTNLSQYKDARSISNMRNNLDKDVENLNFIKEHKAELIAGNAIGTFDAYDLMFASGYGNRSKGEVYLILTYNKNDNKYDVVGLPNTVGPVRLTKDNFDSIITEAEKAITQNKENLRKDEQEAGYDKGHIFSVFLNIKNPLTHDYENSPFPDKYKNTEHETGYIAARQVKKALSDSNDGVIYNNIRDPFEMNSYGVFNPNQIKSATDNNGEFSRSNDDIYYHIVERGEDGTPEVKKYPESPLAISKAREQKIYIELNNRLRDLLRKYGVSIGALEEAEARLGAGGVTDFSTATVLAEGMKELIRLSNGIEGEYALPEEFAHVAVEMLGHDHPLVQRLLNILRTNDKALNEAFGDQLDRYSELYGNDREKLAVEAAGKLIAKQLFQHQAIKTAPVRSLISRICDAIKRFFRRMTTSEIDNAIFDAQGVASQLARDLLSGKMADELSLENITASDSFYKLEKDLSNQSDIRSKILKNTVKRLDIYKRRLAHAIKSGTGSTGAVDFTQRQIDKLERQAETVKLEISIADYLKDTMTFMKEMEDSLKLSIASSPANVVCRKLYTIKDTLYSFSDVIKSVNDALNSGELERTEDLKKSLSDVSAKVTEFWTYYDGQAQKYLEKMLADVYGEDGVTVTIGKNRGRKITPHEMATKADHDISFFSRWFHAASDCDDFVIQAISEVTRDAKRNARERVAQRRSKLNAAIEALKKEQGNLDQSWMFERIDGKRTARYISEEKAKELSPARYNFYKTFMELKREADRFLPEMMTSDRKIIMFRKKVEEKIKAAEGFNATTSEIWDGYVKKAFVEMDVDKNDYDIEEEIKDFDDNIVDQLPIRFLNKTKKESFDDMTEDAATSLLAYMGMAFEYHEMNNVIGLIENARYASSLRDVGYRDGLRTLFEKRGSDKEFHYREPITRKQARTLIQKTIDDFIHMHVYGHLRKDYGTFGKTNISKRKVLDFIMGYASLTQMGLNVHQRIANVNTGATQIIVEATGGKLKIKNVRKATGIWLSETAVGKKGEKSRLVESGKYDRTNKLTLWLDKFDIHQDNGNDNRIDYTKSRARKVFGRNMVYAGLQVGEDYLSATTALAYAMQHKLKGPDGKESDMWDAYEVKYTDQKNKTGAYIALKSGYTKLDGSAITKEDEREFANEVIATNFALQGIYNTDDRSAMQYYALGALGIMYRKWIAPAMKRRFSGVEYSKLRDDYTQGYYITALQLIGNTAKDWFAPVSSEEAEENWFSMLTNFKQAKESLILNWNKLTDYEKGNVWKSVTELGVIALLTVAAAALKGIPDDKDNDHTFLSWAEDMMLTHVLRLRAELSSMAPTPNMVNEFSRIASSPFAAFRTIKDSLGVFNLMWIPNYTEKIKTGRYAGHTKAHKYFMKLPIISFFRKFDKVIDPTDLINYYQNQNY